MMRMPTKIFLTPAFFLAFLLFSSGMAQAAERANANFDPSAGVERSIIGQGVGYAFVGLKTTREDGWQKAVMAAKQQVLRQTEKRFLQRILDPVSGISYRIGPSSAAETMRVMKEKRLDADRKGNTQIFKAQVIAEVHYSLITDMGNRELLANPKLPLTVRTWTDKRVYPEGDQIVIYMQGNRDYYARLFDVAVDGSIIQLLPNQFRQEQHFKGGQIYAIPDTSAGDTLTFDVEPPLGKEMIALFASEEPLGDVRYKEYIGDMFGSVEGSLASLSDRVKNIVPNQGLGLERRFGFRFVEFVTDNWQLVTVAK